MAPQITYDLSGNIEEHGFYGGCWRDPDAQTLAGKNWIGYLPADEQFEEDGNVYGYYNGATGVTLFNKRNGSSSSLPGCLMRKSRLPVDFSEIWKIELDIMAEGSTGKAPWYSVWLAPAIYADTDDNAKAAEIDIIENYDQAGRGHDVNDVKSNFAQCGLDSYTKPYCQASGWGNVATAVNHHITVESTEDPTDGRVIKVHRCPNRGSNLTTCENNEFAEIKVAKPAPAGTAAEWFRVWNKDDAKERYAKYWLVIDMWWTSNTDFQLTADNVKFFKKDGTEWEMPLDVGNPPHFDSATTSMSPLAVV